MDDETDAIVIRYIICMMCQRLCLVDKSDVHRKCPDCMRTAVPAKVVDDPPD